MLIYWNIRYVDRSEKKLKDRRLFLDTNSLPPATKVAVELMIATKTHRTEREVLKHRSLFKEESIDKINKDEIDNSEPMHAFALSNYFENEKGEEIDQSELHTILTGNPNSICVPSGTPWYQIELICAERKPIPIADVLLTPEENRLMGYFVRDYKELGDSSFLKDGPGSIKMLESLSIPDGPDPILNTAVTDEEIRSFVMIFRRLYMTGQHDPASFSKIMPIFKNAMYGHPYYAWCDGVLDEYKSHLDSVPDFIFYEPETPLSFTSKRLIDVFIYTQYAHQPNEQRQRQFNECLNQVQGKRNLLTYMFLNELLLCSLKIKNAGQIIATWFQGYCECHDLTPDILNSLRHEHPGLGKVEKEEDKKTRLFREKSEELAMEIWEQSGCSEGGPMLFLLMARQQLTSALEGEKSD